MKEYGAEDSRPDDLGILHWRHDTRAGFLERQGDTEHGKEPQQGDKRNPAKMGQWHGFINEGQYHSHDQEIAD